MPRYISLFFSPISFLILILLVGLTKTAKADDATDQSQRIETISVRILVVTKYGEPIVTNPSDLICPKTSPAPVGEEVAKGIYVETTAPKTAPVASSKMLDTRKQSAKTSDPGCFQIIVNGNTLPWSPTTDFGDGVTYLVPVAQSLSIVMPASVDTKVGKWSPDTKEYTIAKVKSPLTIRWVFTLRYDDPIIPT